MLEYLDMKSTALVFSGAARNTKTWSERESGAKFWTVLSVTVNANSSASKNFPV